MSPGQKWRGVLLFGGQVIPPVMKRHQPYKRGDQHKRKGDQHKGERLSSRQRGYTTEWDKAALAF